MSTYVTQTIATLVGSRLPIIALDTSWWETG
jgi:hypothetical protein